MSITRESDLRIYGIFICIQQTRWVIAHSMWSSHPPSESFLRYVFPSLTKRWLFNRQNYHYHPHIHLAIKTNIYKTFDWGHQAWCISNMVDFASTWQMKCIGSISRFLRRFCRCYPTRSSSKRSCPSSPPSLPSKSSQQSGIYPPGSQFQFPPWLDQQKKEWGYNQIYIRSDESTAPLHVGHFARRTHRSLHDAQHDPWAQGNNTWDLSRVQQIVQDVLGVLLPHRAVSATNTFAVRSSKSSLICFSLLRCRSNWIAFWFRSRAKSE